jgi:succinyl-diaminopimelate desuccinylase
VTPVGTRPPLPDLVAETARLVAIPSVSHQEAAIADYLQKQLCGSEHLALERLGDNLVASTHLGRPARLLIAGHLDTVPSFGQDQVPRIEDDRVAGLGACDMKGGLAVLSWLATTVADPVVDLTYVFYACEEVAAVYSGLGVIASERPELLEADAAILAEPTAARVEAGCQGTLRMELRLAGRRAHTARPWQGINAIHRLGPLLEALRTWRGRQVELEGCCYQEALQAVWVEGGVAGNVVPDQARLVVNHRFAPDRSEEEAAAALSSMLSAWLGDQDTMEVIDSAPAAPPGLSHPLLRGLLTLSGAPPRAKLGWTDVARLVALGVPATNYGPGDPEMAHSPGEWVERAELEEVATKLWLLVKGKPS